MLISKERGRLLVVGVIVILLSVTSRAMAQSNDSSAQPDSVKTAPAPAASSATDYVIGADDVLAINVWKENEISRDVAVRPDGKISLPLVGELQAAGLHPVDLQKQIADKLQSYISNPEVTVIVQSVKSKKINVVGEVNRPGEYMLTTSMNVLDAIALCGGFKDFAKQSKIYVLRTGPGSTKTRIPFNYKRVIKGKDLAENIQLQPGDTIVVP